MEYEYLSTLGEKAGYAPINNPLTYCLNNTLDQRFLHGSHSDTMGQYSKSCQRFMSEYCSDNWDDICEIASQDTEVHYPSSEQGVSMNLNSGEILVRNTALRKYLTKMYNCERKYEPFDPTVPTSPMISYWTGDCIPVYEVDPETIDNDPVMNKILSKPEIAPDILLNIYNTMKRKGTLKKLKGTKLGTFYLKK